MGKFDVSGVNWQEPWQALAPEEASRVEAELRREICHGHVLFERAIEAIGLSPGDDDYLFYLGEAAPRFAMVHLTYHQETRPNFPYTLLFDTIEQAMVQNADD